MSVVCKSDFNQFAKLSIEDGAAVRKKVSHLPSEGKWQVAAPAAGSQPHPQSVTQSGLLEARLA